MFVPLCKTEVRVKTQDLDYFLVNDIYFSIKSPLSKSKSLKLF